MSKEEVITSGVKAGDVVSILKEDLNGKASYTEITELSKNRLGVTATRIQELLKRAKDEGLVGKEKGRFGEWYAL